MSTKKKTIKRSFCVLCYLAKFQIIIDNMHRRPYNKKYELHKAVFARCFTAKTV